MKQILLTTALIAVGGMASAATTTTLLFKVTDNTSKSLDVYDGWITAGSFNEGVAGATDLTNNGVDYRNGAIDTDWATYETIRVSMYTGGTESAYIEFDAAGTAYDTFFAKANVIGSSWSDLTSVATYNYFSIEGHLGINRHWFVNNNYGGCGRDAGHFIALDGQSGVCSWENGRSGAGSPTTGFYYSNAATRVNWNTSAVGVADTFVVTASYETSEVPLPAAGWLLMGSLAGLGALRRART